MRFTSERGGLSQRKRSDRSSERAYSTRGSRTRLRLSTSLCAAWPPIEGTALWKRADDSANGQTVNASIRTLSARARNTLLWRRWRRFGAVNATQPRSLETRIGRGLGWSTASNITLRIGSVLISVLMARLIAPEEFGVFAVAITVWSVVGTLAEFGLGTDLIRAKDLDRRIPTVATVGLLTSSTFALVMILAAGPIAGVFQSSDAAGVIRLMGLSLVVSDSPIVPAALLQREFRQRALFAINGCGLIASAVTMTLVGLFERRSGGTCVGPGHQPTRRRHPDVSRHRDSATPRLQRGHRAGVGRLLHTAGTRQPPVVGAVERRQSDCRQGDVSNRARPLRPCVQRVVVADERHRAIASRASPCLRSPESSPPACAIVRSSTAVLRCGPSRSCWASDCPHLLVR